GEWGSAGALNEVSNSASFEPAVGQQFRDGSGKRVFFGSWESYFLIAEANLRGWNTPMSDEEAYNKGIEENFEFFGTSEFYSDYVESTEYNRNGTSVKYSHVTEPASSRTMTFKNGKNGNSGSTQVSYPTNDLYENGNVRNDKLTKIITQKFIANTPWL